jgi:hypothetical protein
MTGAAPVHQRVNNAHEIAKAKTLVVTGCILARLQDLIAVERENSARREHQSNGQCER